MRARIAFILLLLPTLAAQSQTRMTIAEAESLLEHRGDDDRATALRNIEFTERVSAARLARWQAAIKDQKTREVLQATASLSAFLPLPVSDLPHADAPNHATELAILSRARAYTANLRPRLPNFTALRTAAHYELAPPDYLERQERAMQLALMTRARFKYTLIGTYSHDLSWFRLAVSKSTVTYLAGREARTPLPASSRQLPLPVRGLETSGEFGSILSIVDRDTINGSIAWHHWENGPRGLLAVFACSVPKEQSHFVIYSPGVLPGMGPVSRNPAYRCQISIDPETGDIYRIALQAENDDPAVLNGVVVEYGAVRIGPGTYTCPQHAIGIFTTRDSGEASSGAVQRYVNDVTFTEYHLFGSESRIIPEPPPAP